MLAVLPPASLGWHDMSLAWRLGLGAAFVAACNIDLVWAKLHAQGSSVPDRPLPLDKLRCRWVRGRSSAPEAVLVACGSFNPPTRMHVRMVELGAQRLEQVSDGHYS